jgi:hypothetical protein
MNLMTRTALVTLLASCAMASADAQQISTYAGPCDASAAVALDADHFVVGDDERNTLHVYRRGRAQAVGLLPLSKFLNTRADEESDIEGAAVIGSRIYWITSHGRNSRGKAHQSRHRLFATEIVPGHPPTLKPVGEPYTDLLDDIRDAEGLKPYKLGKAAHLAAEADGGFNIEGLAATPDGQLLIGFRNPVPQGRALLVPLQNPAEVVNRRRARLGAPIELDLGQRGIRSIELIGSSYLIVAGPPGDIGSFALYRWSGQPGAAATPVAGVDLKDLRPEAVFAIPQTTAVQLLSDDGGVKIAGVECKKLPADRQTFRSLIVTP